MGVKGSMGGVIKQEPFKEIILYLKYKHMYRT